MEEKSKTRRSWFRFSLRTMLVVVTVVCTISNPAFGFRQREQKSPLTHRLIFTDDPFQIDCTNLFRAGEMRELESMRTLSDPDSIEKGMIYDELERHHRRNRWLYGK